jgi:N6-adenosine-specific RNA methylase IME4
MLTNEKLSTIPLKNLLAAGALVAVWCTNSPSNIKDLKEMLFPAWGLEFVATWFWVKVDRSGSTVGFFFFLNLESH